MRYLPHVEIHKMISRPSLAFDKFNCNATQQTYILSAECIYAFTFQFGHELRILHKCTLKIPNRSYAMNFEFRNKNKNAIVRRQWFFRLSFLYILSCCSCVRCSHSSHPLQEFSFHRTQNVSEWKKNAKEKRERERWAQLRQAMRSSENNNAVLLTNSQENKSLR